MQAVRKPSPLNMAPSPLLRGSRFQYFLLIYSRTKVYDYLLLTIFFFLKHFLALPHVGSYSPHQGLNPLPLALEGQSLNHWTTGEIPPVNHLLYTKHVHGFSSPFIIHLGDGLTSAQVDSGHSFRIAAWCSGMQQIVIIQSVFDWRISRLLPVFCY